MQRVYSVFDVKAEAFLQPFFCLTEGQAMRSFVDVANDRGHPMCVHAEDYSLFFLGEFDESNGMLVPGQAPKLVATALEVRHLGVANIAPEAFSGPVVSESEARSVVAE